MTDAGFDNLSGSHLQRQVKGVCQSIVLLCRDIIGCKTYYYMASSASGQDESNPAL